jgi:hypothetical protein
MGYLPPTGSASPFTAPAKSVLALVESLLRMIEALVVINQTSMLLVNTHTTDGVRITAICTRNPVSS